MAGFTSDLTNEQQVNLVNELQPVQDEEEKDDDDDGVEKDENGAVV